MELILTAECWTTNPEKAAMPADPAHTQ